MNQSIFYTPNSQMPNAYLPTPDKITSKSIDRKYIANDSSSVG